MVTALLLALSGMLIGAGLVLLLRDWLGARRLAFLGFGGALFKAPWLQQRGPTEADVTVRSAPARPKPVGKTTAQPAAARPTEAAGSVSYGEAVIFSDPDAAAHAWLNLERTVGLALRAVNAAFAETQAVVSAAGGDAWDAASGRQRLALEVAVSAQPAALLELALGPETLRVRSRSSDGGGREMPERAIPLGNVTVPLLAEVIAASAWPFVMRAKGGGR